MQSTASAYFQVTTTLQKRAKYPVATAFTACIGVLAVFGWGPNFHLAFLSVAVLFLGTWLSWRPGEPAVALVIFGFQWVQASISAFMANIRGIPVNDTAQLGYSNIEGATALSLIGLLVISAGFRIAAGKPKYGVVQRARRQADLTSVKRLASAYFISVVGAAALAYLSTFSGGLRQPLIAFASFKDAVFFAVAYVGIVRGGHFRTLFYWIFVIELLGSLASYFSSFQSVFIYTFIALFAAGVRIGKARMIAASILAAVAIFAGVVWSAVKTDYRTYISGGAGRQVVVVDPADAIGTLLEMSFDLNGADLAIGADRLIKRLTYVEIFGVAMNYVPAVVNHTYGNLWGAAVVHTFTPRILFPNKPIVDASAQTNTYTDLNVAGMDRGTQISIGYMGESYIDYGPVGMFFPLGLYGLIAGFLYRKVLLLPKFAGLISMGLAVPLLMGGSYLNAEAIKICGNLTITAIAIFVAHAIAGKLIVKALLGIDLMKRTRSARLSR